MGGGISLNMCPGEHRYIDDLNVTINNLNGVKRGLESDRDTLNGKINYNIDLIIKDIQYIIYLYMLFYLPLFSSDNNYIVRMPKRIDFSKRVVHRDGFHTLSSPDFLQSNDEDAEDDTYTTDSDLFERLVTFISQHRELELKDVPLENLLAFKSKKEEFDSLKNEYQSLKEGFCEREERDIRDKKNEINRIRDQEIPDLNNNVIPNLTNTLHRLENQHTYFTFVIKLLEGIRDNKSLVNDKMQSVRSPNFTDHDISDRNPVDEGFEPEIHYGSKSGIFPKSDAYEYLYHAYYDALVKAYKIIDNDLQPGVDYLKKTELTGLDYSFETVRNENALVKRQITDNNVRLSTDTKKFFYQTDSFIYLKSVNFCLFILFYMIFIFFVYSVYQSAEITFYYKIMYILLVFLYPFLIKPLEGMLWFFIGFVYSLTFGQIYTGKV